MTANAARVGAPGEEEYEWDSYSKVKEQYRLEELRAVRQAREAQRARKKLERKKLPVSDAHRKAISDAIRAKWNDPVWTVYLTQFFQYYFILSCVPFVY